MRIAITGGRNYNNKTLVYNTLTGLHEVYTITQVIHGNAKGADTLADQWAQDNNIETIYYLPEYHVYGKSAPFIRNQEIMEEYPDLVVAFPGGNGTYDAIKRAKKLNLKILEVEDE